jgi:hypothetical protein
MDERIESNRIESKSRESKTGGNGGSKETMGINKKEETKRKKGKNERDELQSKPKKTIVQEESSCDQIY